MRENSGISLQIGSSLPRLLGLVSLATGLAVLLLGGYLTWNSIQARLALQAAGERAQDEALELESNMRSIQQALASAEVASSARAELRGEATRDDLVDLLRQNNVRNVLNLIVAAEPLEAVDLGRLPGSGYAALEMILQAREDGRAPAQAHFVDTPDEYLAFVQRLEDGGSPLAVIFINLPLSVVANQLALPPSVDGLALMQRNDDESVVLQSVGGTVPARASTIPIEGTRFELAWHRESVIGPIGQAQLAGVLGLGALIALLGFLVLRRTAANAISRSGKAPAESSDTVQAERAEAWPEAEPEPEPEPPTRPLDEPEPPRPAPGPVEPEPEAPGSDLTADGESRRESVQPSELDAPELSDPVSDEAPKPGSRTADEAASKDASADESTDENSDLLFDPDAPADEQGEISEMLNSLMKESSDDQDDPARKPSTPDPEQAAPEAAAEITVPDKSIFRAYDIRGVVGETLDESVAEAIGRAVGSEARHRGLARIAVARDGRLSGAGMLAALTRGLAATGMEVIDVGAVPTPVLYYAAQELGGGSGVMVTGSHNPPDYNGFKIVLGGQTLSGETITALHQRLESGDLIEGKGQISEQRIAVQYIERISTDIQLERPLKVVADCGNGIAGNIAPKLLTAIGADVIPLYAEVDGTFPNHHPDPSDPKTLEDLRLCVRNFNADIGVAFDGDGDRLGVVAPDGEIIYPDRLMMLFARDVLSRNPGAPIIFDVKCSGLLADEIEQAGGKPVMARTGHSFIKAELKQQQSPLAGEMSGHFFFGERWFGFDDGLYAAARLLEILAADTRAAGQILASLPKAESTPELKVPMKEGQPHAFVEAFQQQARFEGAEVSTIDGVRADFEDGFGLVRASNTTPILVVRFEGTDKAALARIQELFREAMLAINPALKLPF